MAIEHDKVLKVHYEQSNKLYTVSYSFLDSPGSTSPLTYKLTVTPDSSGGHTIYLNRPHWR